MKAKDANYLRSLGLLCAATLLVMGPLAERAPAQLLYGSVVGSIEDASGALIPDAQVVITNKATGFTRTVTADSAGRYSILNVPAGTYDLVITAAGFRRHTRTDVQVAINTVSRVDARLELGAVTEQVTVAAAAVALQTDKSDVRHEITGTVVQNLPLPNYRNYQSLMMLVPGATPPAFQNAVVDTPGRALTTNLNGTPRNNNNTLVDGAANINIWLPHHVAYVQPVESIDTVNISTGSFDAEQGMAGGAAITLASKSGTNDLHGTGWWFHNNQRFNSDGVYFRSANYEKPLKILNIFGGNIGGPIKRDKLFYFFNFERTTERTGYYSSYSVAPEDFRQGDFSRFMDRWIVYDPASAPMTTDGARQRTPFPGNRVPQARWNPIFPNIYKDVPLPNQVSVTDPLNLGGNYGVGGVLSLNRNQYDLKINYNVSNNLVTWTKYSRMDAPVAGKYIFGDLGGPALGTEGFGDTTTQVVTAGYTYTFSPTFLFDGVFGYTPMDQVVGIPNVDQNIGLDVWNIPGTNGGVQYADDDRYGGAPQVQGFGFTYVGVAATWAPVWRKERTYTYATNFSKIAGSHELRWGFDARQLQLNHWQPETANPRGNISFGAGTTYNANDINRGTANSFAAALLGLVSSYSKSIQFFEMKTREWQLAWYFRDRWQVNRRLTLNLGLRYENYPLMHRGDRGLERWDPFTNIVYFGGLGNTPRDAGLSVSNKLFAPRVGFAFRITEKTVFRSGYGISFDPVPFGRPLRGQYPATLTGSWSTPVSTYGWFNTVDQGIPEIPTPDVSQGQLELPPTVNMGPRSPWGYIKRGYVQSWNGTLERILPWEMVGSVAYVGTRTIGQLMDRNINTIGPGLGTSTANLPLAKAHGRRIGANMWDGIGYGAYDSLQATLQKNFTHGLFLRTSYTFGKALNMADDTGWVGLRAWHWEPMMHRNYGPAGYDRTHSFTTAWNYELPVGRGKRFTLANRAADLVLGGWKLSGTFVAYSGTPFWVDGSGSSLQCTGCRQTAHQIAPVRKIGLKGPQQPYYDPMSFRDPLFYFDPANPVYTPGNMGWGAVRGPGYWQLNPAIYKSFSIKEGVDLEFRAESNNFTNTPIWGNPNGGSGGLRLNPDGTLNTNIANPTGNFMSITSASTGRDFRFGLRLAF